MRIKKLLSVILAAVITLSAFSVISFAETEGIYTYTVSGEAATVTGINYAGVKELTIPDTLGGYPVKTISGIGNTYSYGTANMVETLYIPESVTTIGWAALRMFDCAKAVVDENNPNYSSDEYGVIFNKNKTTLVACPCSLQQKEYIVPDTVKEIEYCAFEQCAFIEKIILPDGLESMGNQSFCQMPKLREINIPEGITELGQNMFIQCGSLENITLPSTLKKVSNSSLSETPVRNIIVPNGVTSIDTYAFESCKKLEWIELPATVHTIGYEVFANCDSLKYIFYRGSEGDWASININASNANDLEKYKIVYNYSPETGYPGIDFTYADGFLTLGGEGATPSFNRDDYHYWDEYAGECEAVIVDSAISEIGTYSFVDFAALEYLVVYSENIVFSENAFFACDSLENVIITGSAGFSRKSFNAPDNLKIYIDKNRNPDVEPDRNLIRFTCSDGVLNFIDDVSFDIYHLIDFVSAVIKKYGIISRITFRNMTLDDIELNYIAEYTDKSEPVVRSVEGNNLVNGEIKIAKLSGSELTFNDLIEIIQSGSEDGFMLVVSDENHKTIINPNVGIEDSEGPADPPDSDEEDETEGNAVIDGIVLVFDTVYVNVVKAIKWAVTLLNKLFKLISKK